MGTLIALLCNKKGRIPPVSNTFSFIITALAILSIYFAPIGFDRHQYELMFLHPGLWGQEKDFGWEIYNSFFRFLLGKNVKLFIFINDILYTSLFVYFGYKCFKKEYRFYFLLLVFISLGYYSGGTNVMRSGLATALVFLGLSKLNKPWWFVTCAVCACTIHLSVGLTIVGLTIGYFYPNLKVYVFLWLTCVVLSYTDSLGPVTEYMVNLIGDNDSRLSDYTSQIGEKSALYTKMGFRVDFIIYSALPLLLVYYYKIKCHYRNRFYDVVTSAYLIANSVWLCVIRMPYTDRIALLSWVLIPIVSIYPPLKDPLLPNRNVVAALAFVPAVALKFFYLW
ncbi:MAG: EpsG family protein [Bacteroidales bacterium]|nr:EpsG family protein [Bacteroidales bacterium]